MPQHSLENYWGKWEKKYREKNVKKVGWENKQECSCHVRILFMVGLVQTFCTL